MRRAEEAHLPVEQIHLVKPLWKLALIFASAAVTILITGPYLAKTSGQIADLSGLGRTFVGTTFVALSTSLPELVASLAALRIGAFDLCVGNIFGSNAFNMLLFWPLDLVYPGSLLGDVSQIHLISAFFTVVATSVVLMGQLYHVEKRRRFVEPDSYFVVLLIVFGFVLIYLYGPDATH
jgi:cation:H+ antiporter